jgi:hypothetical protein
MSGKVYKFFGLAVVLILTAVQPVFAQYTSPNYKVNETFFGAGGELSDQSAHYQAKVSAGELGIDHTSSTNFQAYSGFNTTDLPYLEVFVNGGTYDLGYLDISAVKAITSVFTVRSYLSTGYTVSLTGNPPSNRDGTHPALAALATPTASNPGTEQFGINLVANNIAPIGPFGAGPTQVPDATFSFGQAAADYSTANLFKYVENDIIARSLSSSGVTQYTISAIANASKHTLAGFYTTDMFVDVVPTF